MDDSLNMQYALELAKLIQCETVSVTGVKNEEKFTAFHNLLLDVFPSVFSKCETEIFDCSLLIKWKGTSDRHPICLMSHHDVVDADGEWDHPPFSGDICDGKIWGRGTLDTKGSLWAILRAAEDLINEGYIPQNDIYIESASTEETDGSGADIITKALQSRGIKFDFVIDEGGLIVHDPLGGCDHVFAMIGVGEKAYADIKFVAKSDGGHASTPPRDTPLVRLGKFMVEADKAKCFDVKVNNPVCEMFTSFAPYSHGILGFLFKHVKLLRPLLCLIMPKVSPTAAAMLRTTIAFTQARGSNGTNVLPQEAFVIGNIRASHHQGLDNSIKAITEIANKYNIEVVPIDISISSGITKTDSKGYKLVSSAVTEIFTDEVSPAPYIMNGASDSKYFDRVSDCCIRFAPFKVSSEQLGSIHGLNENLDIETLSKAVSFFKYIIKEN